MTRQRDVVLGARLDALGVLEHDEGYWQSLEATIESLAVNEQKGGEHGIAETAGSAAAVERDPTFGGFRHRAWLVAVVGIAAVLSLVFGTRLATRSEVTLGTEPASAAAAVRLSLDVLSNADAVEGTVRAYDNGVSESGSTVLTLADEFLATRDGSLRLESIADENGYHMSAWGSDARMWVVYDAQTRRLQCLVDAGTQGTKVTVNDQERTYRYLWYDKRKTAPGPPDSASVLEDFPFWRLRAYLRTLLSMRNVRLSVTSVDGRETWLVTAPWVVGSQRYRATVSIDAETRLPYSVVYCLGKRRCEWRFDLSVRSEPVDSASFTLQAPPAGQAYRDDMLAGGAVYTFVDLPTRDDAKARRMTRGTPAVPLWLPQGFRLQHATVANGREGVFIVSLVYRCGFDRIVVTTRPDPRSFSFSTFSIDGSPPIRTDTSDPFVPTMSPGERAAWRAQTLRVAIVSGGFAGSSARIVTDPGHWPHLWVKKDGVVATIAGDLTTTQMTRIAASLEPWGER